MVPRNRLCDLFVVLHLLTLLGPQSRFGDKLLVIRVVCPQNGTAVLKALTPGPVVMLAVTT